MVYLTHRLGLPYPQVSKDSGVFLRRATLPGIRSSQASEDSVRHHPLRLTCTCTRITVHICRDRSSSSKPDIRIREKFIAIFSSAQSLLRSDLRPAGSRTVMPPSLSPSATSLASSLLRERVSSRKVPPFWVSAVTAHGVIHSHAEGAGMDGDAVLRIFSMTKLITCVSLSLDARDVREALKRWTVARRLAAHRSRQLDAGDRRWRILPDAQEGACQDLQGPRRAGGGDLGGREEACPAEAPPESFFGPRLCWRAPRCVASILFDGYPGLMA